VVPEEMVRPVIRGDITQPVVDRDAAEQQLIDLMNRYEQSLAGYLAIFAGDRELSCDLVQETFIKAYHNLCQDRPVTARWLWTVGRNLAVNHFRRHNRLCGSDDDIDLLLDEKIAESHETHLVRKALDRLPDEDREVLYLHVVDRFQTAEIAEMLGTRPTAVRMRLVRARRRFRAAYEAEA
jgi:RNA polymerase sigma-70 factor (ECF subfamily)